MNGKEVFFLYKWSLHITDNRDVFTASNYVFIDNTGKWGIVAFLLGISGVIFTYLSDGNI
ncbi:hypothetical protein OR571_17315 [Psychrobacillus sp. NEAU-3TGS]|uniref:hypothetical protein n=1 Tax=Psychrobacillus sp. NEAU-3TGS TaxID=2995412 RepID=UPI002495BE77|nr:hypothetical protein [Psychrobacillus sp. NEAU-3TGS]MDI2588810.1 hypothetical protein [Psychrobacillus sp. NEAU-3TGS]